MVNPLVRAVLLALLLWAFHTPAQQSEADRQLFKQTKEKADKGDSEAQLALGNLYFAGTGVSKSFSKGAKWHLKAAEQGLALAQYQVGLDYALGEGLKVDAAQAAEWFRKAAEQNIMEAQLELGLCCLHGNGMSANGEEAVHWFRQAVAQGSVEAEHELGKCFMAGTGVPKDVEQGIRWIEHAAQRGFPPAQNTLGQCYQKGTGVPVDPLQAYKWFSLAASRDDSRAADIRVNIAKVETQLSKEKVAEAQKLAREFRASNPPLPAEETPTPSSPATLEGLTGMINVDTSDTRSEVFADGSFVGNSPAKLRLKEGPHVIEVKRAGFKDYRRHLTVTAGSELNLHVEFEKAAP
jgi:TPR repeat protein